MLNKKQKTKNVHMKSDDKQKAEQQTYQFEVHTMQSDNEQPNTQQVNNTTKQAMPQQVPTAAQNQNQVPKAAPTNIDKTPPTNLPVSENAVGASFAQNTAKQEQNNKQVSADNPFLTSNTNTLPSDGVKGSFAPGKKKEQVEKINYKPEDIAESIKDKGETKKKKKKSTGVIVLILSVILILGGAGFAAYYFLFNDTQTQQDVITYPQEQEDPMDQTNDIENDMDTPDTGDNVMDTGELNEFENETQQVYSTELPNYFSFDVESQTSKEDILTELSNISTNIQAQGLTEPVSFIVTDANNNPVSFNVFAMSIGFTLPQDILSALEEDFELYAYDDGANGTRFGFVVDIKDAQALQSALLANEPSLPEALDPLLDGKGSTAVNVVFSDSSYKTHPIRYFNIDKTESYSIDYTINNTQWVVGTTKQTIRAMLDAIHNSNSVKVQQSM